MKTVTQRLIERKNIEQSYTGDIYSITVKDETLSFKTISEFNNLFFKIVGLSENERLVWERKVGFRSLYSDFVQVSKKHSSLPSRVKKNLPFSTIIKQNPFGDEYLAPNVFLFAYSYVVNSIGDLIIEGKRINFSNEELYNYETGRRIKVIENIEESDINNNLTIESGKSIRSNLRITYSGYDPTIIRFFGLDGLNGSTGNIQNIYDENHPNPHPSTGGTGYGPNYGWYPKLWRGNSNTWTKIGFAYCDLVVESTMFFKQVQINGLQVVTVSGVSIRLYYGFNGQLYDYPQIRIVEILGALNNGHFIYWGSKPLGGVATSWYQQTGPNSGFFVNDAQFKFSNADLGGNNVYTFKDFQNLNKNNRPNITHIYFPHDANFGIKSTKGLPYYDYCHIKIYIVTTIPHATTSTVNPSPTDTPTNFDVFDGMVLY